MSHPDATNPYASPTAVPTAPGASPTFKPIDKIEYLRMYQYVFDSPNWLMNVVLGAICSIIPIVGPLVMIGYQFEVVSSLLATQGMRYPDFDFNRFVDYLVRGLWPFLVQLVASLVLTPVILMVIFVPLMILAGVAGAVGDKGAGGVFAIGLPFLVLIDLPIVVLISLVLVPPLIRAGLARDFVEGFNLNWVIDFLKKTWLEMSLGLLFIAFSAAILAILGMLACGIGLYVVMPVIFLAQAHMYYQLYLLYLSRGGTPVMEKVAAYAPPR